MGKNAGNNIREIRESRHINQCVIADEIGVTQQMISKYENDISTLKIDVLLKLAKYFNVTTDYLLGISDAKRGNQEQLKVNKTLEECYEFLECFKSLDEYDKEILWVLAQQMKKSKSIKKKVNKENKEENRAQFSNL